MLGVSQAGSRSAQSAFAVRHKPRWRALVAAQILRWEETWSEICEEFKASRQAIAADFCPLLFLPSRERGADAACTHGEVPSRRPNPGITPTPLYVGHGGPDPA